MAAAAELLPALWEGISSEHLAAAHVGALLEAYGELLLLLLVSAGRDAQPPSASRRQVRVRVRVRVRCGVQVRDRVPMPSHRAPRGGRLPCCAWAPARRCARC